VPAVVGVPVIVSVVEIAVDINVRPGGSVPVVDHAAAVATVNAPELYATPSEGFVNKVGDMDETIKV
jgi:hypothetical protein